MSVTQRVPLLKGSVYQFGIGVDLDGAQVRNDSAICRGVVTITHP